MPFDELGWEPPEVTPELEALIERDHAQGPLEGRQLALRAHAVVVCHERVYVGANLVERADAALPYHTREEHRVYEVLCLPIGPLLLEMGRIALGRVRR